MGLRVMVIDDSATMRKMLLRNLRRAGYNVTSCAEVANGEEALKLLDSAQPDVIFLDLNMPVMDGFEFARRLRAASAKTPILLVTAEAATAKLADAVACGANGYLPKPPQPEDLKIKLSLILEPEQG